MKIGKLCTIGDSQGVVILREHLQQLGWFKGDHLQQLVVGNELVIRNLTERDVRPITVRRGYLNAEASRARRG